MTKEEILRLGDLSRIKMIDAEAEAFKSEIDSILAYVSAVDALVDKGDLSKTPGSVFNVFREDVVTNEPGSYTRDIVQAFPEKHGDFLKVKKILNPDSTS